MISAEDFLAHHPAIHNAERADISRASSPDVLPENTSDGDGEQAFNNSDTHAETCAYLEQQVEQLEHQHESASSYFDQFIDDAFDTCKEAALRLLDAAPRSSGALRDRLQHKGYEDDVIDRVIARLIELQLIDDYAYAQTVVQQCIARCMGAQGARMTLMHKRVDRELSEQVIQQAEHNGLFDKAAWELGRQVFHKTRRLDIQVRRRRFWSAAGRKGHNPSVVADIAHELFQE